MRICHSLGAIFATGGAIALTVGLGVMPASAASATWSVTPGGSYTSTVVGSEGETFVLLDYATGGNNIMCKRATGHFSFESGSGLTDVIGRVQKIVTKGCYLNLAQPEPVTVTFSGPAWSLHALNYDSQDGRTIGRAYHVHLTVSSPSCSFVIDGSGGATADDAWIPFTHYNGDTFQLGGASGSKPGTMEAYDVSGCTGIVADGNPITLGYISTLSGDLTVTSP